MHGNKYLYAEEDGRGAPKAGAGTGTPARLRRDDSSSQSLMTRWVVEAVTPRPAEPPVFVLDPAQVSSLFPLTPSIDLGEQRSSNLWSQRFCGSIR